MAAAKPKPSKIAGFKEYVAIASHLGPINEDVSSSKYEAQDEELEGKTATTVAIPFVGRVRVMRRRRILMTHP